MTIYRIPLRDLKPHVNPLDGQMWKCGPLDPEDIRKALLGSARELRSWNDVVRSPLTIDQARTFHILRIATLMEARNHERIVVIVENHERPIKVYLNDGNHRLAAAYVSGDETIDAVVVASVAATLHQVFPNAQLSEASQIG